MKKLLVICPAWNEAEKLPKLLNEFKQLGVKTDLFNVANDILMVFNAYR